MPTIASSFSPRLPVMPSAAAPSGEHTDSPREVYSNAMQSAHRGMERTTAALKAAGNKSQAALAGARIGMASGTYAGAAVGTVVGLSIGEVAAHVVGNANVAARGAALGCRIGSAVAAATVGVAGAALGTIGGVLWFVHGGTPKADPKTVANLDLQRYLGTWYEMAHYDNWFEQPGQPATAEYSLRGDGTIKVLNTAYDPTTGQRDAIEGTARVGKEGDPSKLKVSFAPFVQKYFVGAANYWVLDVGPNYEYAVVGDPTRSSLWVLSRTKKMDDATYQTICEHVKAQGFEPSRLLKSGEVPV